jgi:hypothetical protein
MRSHWFRTAAVAVLAAAVLGACGGGEAKTTSKGSVGDATRPGPADEPDWRNRSYAIDCGWEEQRVVTLRDGELRVGEEPDARWLGLQEAVHVQVDSDGADEVVAFVECAYGANNSSEHAFLYDWFEGSFRRLGDPVTGERVDPDGDGLVVIQPVYGPDDANCCPSAYEHIRYQFGAGGYKETGRSVKPNPDAVTPATAPVPAVEAKLGGLGPVAFGTPAVRALPVLRAALGPPDHDSTIHQDACEGGQSLKQVVWGDMAVNFMGDAGSTDLSELTLVGYGLGVKQYVDDSGATRPVSRSLGLALAGVRVGDPGTRIQSVYGDGAEFFDSLPLYSDAPGWMVNSGQDGAYVFTASSGPWCGRSSVTSPEPRWCRARSEVQRC